jgi:4-amino-4-deoxy-L-arabinose transferase-like glycosyltransferase
MYNKLTGKPWLAQMWIVVFASLLFIPFLGGVHLFDWDEINFAESAREMIVSGNYLDVQINFQPFWEKPPMFIWFQVLSMKVFGINEFAARFPNAVCGIVTFLSLHHVGRKLYDAKFGFTWILVYASSFLPYIYFKSGIIDPWFNLFIFNGIAFFIFYIHALQEKHSTGKQLFNLIVSACLIGLAVLTKGPVAFLVFSLCLFIFLLLVRFKLPVRPIHVCLYLVVFSLVGGFWFILQWLNGNSEIVMEFIRYQVKLFSTKDAGHGGFLFYHFIVLLVGVFPASVYALPSLFKKSQGSELQLIFRKWMIILFWVVLILFTIVKTKIVHYSSLCYFPLTFLATLYLYESELHLVHPKRWVLSAQLVLGGIIALVAIAIPLLAMNLSMILEKGWITDVFAAANMKAAIHWSVFEMLGGIILSCGLAGYAIFEIRKKPGANSILLVSALISISLITILITPRIEGYSQRAAIEFYQNVSTKDAYASPLGFRSYAHLYYANRQPSANHQAFTRQWLLTGDIDKDAYFVVKINKLESNLKKYPSLEVLYEKNGFVFLRRKTIKNDKK